MTATCSAQWPTSMKVMARLLRKYTWLSFLAVKGSWRTTAQVERSTHPMSTPTVAVCVPFPFAVQPAVLHHSWPESGRPASGTCAVHLHRGWAPMAQYRWRSVRAHCTLVQRLTTSCQPFATCKHVTVGPQELLVVVEEVNYPKRGSNGAACTERSTALAAWHSGVWVHCVYHSPSAQCAAAAGSLKSAAGARCCPLHRCSWDRCLLSDCLAGSLQVKMEGTISYRFTPLKNKTAATGTKDMWVSSWLSLPLEKPTPHRVKQVCHWCTRLW